MINSVNQSVYSHFNSLPQYSAQNKTNKSPVWANFKINRQLTDNLNNNTTKASIFYINDVHGQNIRMERLLTAVQQFDSFTPSGQVDKMKFASGDIMLGEDIKHLMVGNKFLNLGGFMANVLGNHECDEPTPEFVNIIKDKTYRLLGLNLNPNKDNPLHGIIEKSYIQGYYETGAIVGRNRGKIINCTNESKVVGDYYLTGGIAGRILNQQRSKGPIIVDSCNIIGTTEKSNRIGGIGGNTAAWVKLENMAVKNSKIQSYGSQVGGIIGLYNY